MNQNYGPILRYEVQGDDVQGAVLQTIEFDGDGLTLGDFIGWVRESGAAYELATPVQTVEDVLTWMQDFVEFTPEVQIIKVESDEDGE